MTAVLLERARQLIQTNRHREAEQELRSILSQEPDNTEAIVLLSICQSEADKMEEANRLIQTAISHQPSNPYYLYIQASFFLKDGKIKEAEKYIKSAISFDPTSADLYGMLSMIKLNQKEWSEALQYANDGLALDSENLNCLNSRSTALFKLDKKEEAYNTIKEALDNNPENDNTHTNVGWSLLEKGEHQRALEHFREALRINPQSSYAKAGLVQGLKARYWFYRMFLRYVFWLNNLKGKAQWAIIIGLYIAVRVLGSVSESNPELAVFITPVITLYMIFAISTWIITPLSNLFLRLNVYGRYALTREETIASNFTGIALLIGLAGGIGFLFGLEGAEIIMIYGISMMIPLSSMLNPPKKNNKQILVAYTVALALIGLLVIFGFGSTMLVQVYVFGIIIYQFAANALMTR